MQISVNSRDFARMQRLLSDFERRQFPFAAAKALTATAKAAQVDVTRGMSSAFDRPTPFTERSIAVQPAQKTLLEAEVFVRPIQARYLGLQEAGGTRRPKRKALVIPAGIKLNPFGNIPNQALKRVLARWDTFSGTVNGVGGVWQRPLRGVRRNGGVGTKGSQKGLKLLVRFDGPKRVTVSPWFMPAVTRAVSRDFRSNMKTAMTEALRTARR
jgi:hypothetical protein